MMAASTSHKNRGINDIAHADTLSNKTLFRHFGVYFTLDTSLMSLLCLSLDMTSSEWASWVQAVGSIAAIGCAIWVANRQHKSSIAAIREDHRLSRIDTAKSLLELAQNCLKLLAYAQKELKDREAIHQIAELEKPFSLEEFRMLEGALVSIPLHTLPHTFVSKQLMVCSTVRQLREQIERALHFHRQMSAEDFDAFLSILPQMQDSLSATCAEIQAEVSGLETSV